MQEFDYYQPASLAELSEKLAETGGCLLAGGTDIIPRMRRNNSQIPSLVDASKVSELKFIDEKDGRIFIGSLITHHEIETSKLLNKSVPSLVKAAVSIGSAQTRSRGTIGGNLCNASPAADLAPPLLTFDSSVRILHHGTIRDIPLEEFFVVPGKTQIERGDVLQSISFPKLTGTWGMAFIKVGKRNGMAISIANVAVSLRLSADGKIEEARIALGSVAPTPILSGHVAQMLIGKKPSSLVFKEAAEACQKDIHPISDVRASAEYRMSSAVVLVKRALMMAATDAEQRRTA